MTSSGAMFSTVALVSLVASASGYHINHVPRPSPLHAARTVAPVRAVAGALQIETAAPAKVLYDGQCMVRANAGTTIRSKPPRRRARVRRFVLQVCLTNKAVLSFFDRRKTRLEFVNIRDDDYSPAANGNVAFEDAMRHFHVISDGMVSCAITPLAPPLSRRL